MAGAFEFFQRPEAAETQGSAFEPTTRQHQLQNYRQLEDREGAWRSADNSPWKDKEPGFLGRLLAHPGTQGLLNAANFIGPGPKAALKGALPMDQASRLARAREMGFDVDRPLYVSTLNPISEFKPHGEFMGNKGITGISLTDNPAVANRYLERYGNFNWKQEPFHKSVMPVYIRPGNLQHFDGPIPSKTPMGHPLPEGYKWPAHLDGVDTAVFPDFINAKGKGVKHVPPTQKSNVLRSLEYILRDPSRIRSVNADFDPALINSPNLMASHAAPAIGAAGAGALGAFARGNEENY